MHVASIQSEQLKAAADHELGGSAITIGAGSFALAAVEAVCVFFIALGKMGILVGLASFFSSVIVSRYHAPIVRTPALMVALLGAAANSFALWNWHRLRNAPAAAWRRRALSLREKGRFVFLIVLAAGTILLSVTEFVIHAIEHT